jgi:hypothetical protein
MAIAVSFILGVAVGALLGFLLPAGAQSWVGRREWKEASRELELADRLLEVLAEGGEPQPVDQENGFARGAPSSASFSDGSAVESPASRPG